MTQAINNLAQINLHNVIADSHSSKNSGKKVWEEEFLSQQVRWSQSPNQPPFRSAHKGAETSGYMTNAESYGGRNVGPEYRDLDNQQYSYDHNQHRPINKFTSGRNLLTRSEVSSVALIGRYSSEIKPGGNRLPIEGKFMETSVKVNADSFRTVLVGQAEKPAYKNKKNNREYGGLAVYRGNRLYLWLRSKSPEFTRNLYKSMTELGIKLMRWVVNGHIIKS